MQKCSSELNFEPNIEEYFCCSDGKPYVIMMRIYLIVLVFSGMSTLMLSIIESILMYKSDGIMNGDERNVIDSVRLDHSFIL